jgi:hypothetical protein
VYSGVARKIGGPETAATEEVAVARAALTASPDTGCASSSYSGHAYWFCPLLRTWQDARSKCQAIGFDLAVVDGSGENQFVLGKESVGAWIGGTDSAVEGKWVWAPASNSPQFWQGKANGSATGGLYTNWRSGQPDDLLNQDCAAFQGGSGNGKWTDESCSLLLAFVCEGDLCPNDANKTDPGVCGCGVADTDTDRDGTPDCVDGCFTDPNKTTAGVCGCGAPDTDTDRDGAPDCVDQCPSDASKTAPGTCGCANAPSASGTACSDGACAVPATCNGHGVCGSPSSCAPDSSCRYMQRSGETYWWCSNLRTWTDARDRCRSQPGGDLIQVDDAREQQVLSSWIAADSWVGGNDRRLEGAWRWASRPFDDGAQFWSGGPAGVPVAGAFAAWKAGQPDNAAGQDCAYASKSGGAWLSDECHAQHAFACEVGIDLCPTDSNKNTPGICGCGTSEADTDGDGTPDCKDQCPNDPLRTTRGACGCVGGANPAPSGTPCQDGICGAATCDGAGSCGNLQACAPDQNCTAKLYHRKVYWICKNLRSWVDARGRCTSRPRTDLVTLDDPNEDELVAASVTSDSWIGANDTVAEGQWTWANGGKVFWSGKADGTPVGGQYSAWAPKEPDDLVQEDCAALRHADAEWDDEPCSSIRPFVCESCMPTTCAAQGAQCGTISDGCGGTLDCNSAPLGCTAPQVCFTAANRCSDPQGKACRAGLIPDMTLPPEQSMRKYYADAAACAAPGMNPCLAKLLGDSHYDTHEAARSCTSQHMDPSDHATLNLDRAHKQQLARADASYACRVAAADGDHDLYPDDVDQCLDTPPLTPTTANGCTTAFRVHGPSQAAMTAQWARTKLMRDRDCDTMTFVPTPVPYNVNGTAPGAKSIGLLTSVHPDGCDMYYEIDADAVLTDGTRRSFHVAFKESEYHAIGLPPNSYAIYFYVVRTDDPGDRGAWAAADVSELVYSIRAINGNGAKSFWSAAVHQGREPTP